EAARLARRVGTMLQPCFGACARRFGRAVDDTPRHVDLPAVVEAAQSAFLVAAERERRAPMRAMQIEHTELPVRVAKGDEILAEKTNRRGLAVRLGDFLGQAGRNPVRAHE